MKKLRVVIAGQLPPPLFGQSIAIDSLIRDLSSLNDLEVEHWEFNFTKRASQARALGLRKILEVFRALARLARLRFGGPVELLVYPVGGPQTIPLIRDLILLPFAHAMVRSVVLHFHAAGFAERAARQDLLSRLVTAVYGRAAGAVVMAGYNRRDPWAAGIRSVYVIPHRLTDELDPRFVARGRRPPIFLYMGHLCPDKGTPALLHAFARLTLTWSGIRLRLAGEPLPPFDEQTVEALVSDLGLSGSVDLLGVVTGNEKKRAFGEADIFVFPSIAPYESFGLVIAEAYMWELPMVVSNWRGNADVAKSGLGGILYSPGGNHVNALHGALSEAMAKRAHWQVWGECNRKIFEACYCRGTGADSGWTEIIHAIAGTSRGDSG